MNSRKYVLVASVAISVAALDQWTKFIVLDELTTALDGATTTGERLSRYFGDAPKALPFGNHYGHKRTVTVSEDFLRLRYAENPGAAFGILRNVPDNVRGPLFHAISWGAVILILSYVSKLTGKDPKEVWALWGLPLVLGGAVGNYIDRLSRGFVIDFLEAHWFDNANLIWPSFNVADSAICVGVGLLIIDSFVRKELPKASPTHASSPV